MLLFFLVCVLAKRESERENTNCIIIWLKVPIKKRFIFHRIVRSLIISAWNARSNLFNFNNSFDPSKTNNENFQTKQWAKKKSRRRNERRLLNQNIKKNQMKKRNELGRDYVTSLNSAAYSEPKKTRKSQTRWSEWCAR